MNLSGESFFNTIKIVDRNVTGGNQVSNRKVYNRNYSWTWDIGSGQNNPPGDLIIYDLEADNIYQTVSFTSSYVTYFRASEIYFDEDLTFITSLSDLSDIRSTISGTLYYRHYVQVEIDPDNNFAATITDLGRTQIEVNNGSIYIIDYNKKDGIIYALNTGSSGNFGNNGLGTRFIKHEIDGNTNSFISQDWRGNSPSIVGGGNSQEFIRNLKIDFYGDEDIVFLGVDQEAKTTTSLHRYSYKNDSLVLGEEIVDVEPNQNPATSLAFYDIVTNNIVVPYVRWNNLDDNVNIRYYSADTLSLLKEVNSFDTLFFSFVGELNYNQQTKEYQVIGGNTFGVRRYEYTLAEFQRDSDILLLEETQTPLLENPINQFEILATASTVSVFGATGIDGSNAGGNIDRIGVDGQNNDLYILVNGQPAGASAKIVKTDLNFNLVDSWDIDRNTPYNSLDSREVKGFFDDKNLIFYTILQPDSADGSRDLVKIEIDSMTLSSSTISTLDEIAGTELGNGTFNYMFGVVDDILYWNHGYQQIQNGKQLYFRTHNVNTGVETSAVWSGTYSNIRNIYFDQDNLTVYYSLFTDKKRYKYDYNTLTSSVVNPYPYENIPNVIHIGTASVGDPNKIIGFESSGTFKEVTVNYTSNTYFSNIDPKFTEGVIIEHISNDILYGYNSAGELYKIERK